MVTNRTERGCGFRRLFQWRVIRARRHLPRAIASSLFALLVVCPVRVLWAVEDSAAVEARLAGTVKHLASDELEGRGVGTRGLDLAADFIAAKFADLGLKTDLYDGTPFQEFQFGAGAALGPEKNNRLVLFGPADNGGGKPRQIALKLAEDFTPMSIGGSGKFDLPLVFAGYGITAEEAGYDDYCNFDVKGKAVLILHKEPQQDDPQSKFNGTHHSRHATFQQKVANAKRHGAAALIIVNDRFDVRRRQAAEQQAWQQAVDKLTEANAKFKQIGNPTPEQFSEHLAKVDRLADKIKLHGGQLGRGCDGLISLSAGGNDAQAKLPVMFATRAALDPVLKAALGADLAALEAEIDRGPTPKSSELASWRAVGETRVKRQPFKVKNVVGVLEGEGPLADETVVVGAHYDHLGYRRNGSGPPKPEDIYNGADDNASGVAVLVEVARRLAARQQKLPRRVVFIAFTAEERGLRGSRHFVAQPLFPLEKTVAMLNLDVMGRLRDNKLYAMGRGTGAEFKTWIDAVNKNHGFTIGNNPSGYGSSDHMPFFTAKVPVVHFITGGHPDLHRTTDDFEKINFPGLRRVAEMVADVVVYIAEAEKRPEYNPAGRPRAMRGGGNRWFCGGAPVFGRVAAFPVIVPR